MAIKNSKYVHKIQCTCPFCKAKRGETRGINNSMYRKKQSKESNDKRRAKVEGDKNPAKREDVRAKISKNVKGKNKGREPWNKSLTKETDLRVKKIAESFKIVRRFMVLPTKDTSIELKLQNILEKEGIKFEKHKPILGQPDIFIEPNICIFADGDYWHNRPERIRRDVYVNRKLKEKGYTILRFWEHTIHNDIDSCLNEILSAI